MLPPLLAATGTFAALRERLGSAGDDPRRTGRHVGLVAVPHGAKSYLAATLALAADGERLVWIARDAEIGDRVAEELGAWLGDPEAVAVLEPRTSLAYERSELIADETAARVAALAAWRSGRARVLVASVQSLLQHTIDPTDLPDAPRELRLGARIHQDALLRELFELGYVPVTEVAGRGESARRGGIVDVFPPSMPLPIRIEFFGDEIDSLRSFDPTDQRTVGTIESAVLLPATEFLLPAGGAAAIRERLGRAAARLPERLAADLARFDAERLEASPRVPGHGRHAPPARRRRRRTTRALAVGDAAEVWAAHLAPSTALDHLDPGTLLVLDEPGDIAESAEFLWRQADERRAELVEAGELPKDWPSTYLPPRDWKSRLVASRTLELTWESVPPEDVAMARGALSSGDPFGWREPVLPAGRAGRLADALDAWRADGARIVLASDQAPRLADLLGEVGDPVAVVGRVGEAPPPGAIALVDRSLNGGFIGGPDGLAFVTDRELFGTVRVRRPRALRRVVPRDILERLTPGDLVVHIDHGVARYEGMLRRGGAGEDRDYLELSFAGGDRIFVPVEQIGRVSRYAGGERPALSRLGGTEWLRAKQRVRKAVDDLAEELLALYASRADARGHAFAPDTPWQSEMEASFPYEETIDQLRAAAEVKADMELDPADGPARRRRRRLRQDRGRAAGRVQGDPGRQAGRRPRADDRPRRAARGDLLAALRGLPARGPPAVALRRAVDPGGDDRGSRRRHGRHRHRHAPAAQQGRPLPRPRAGRRRRGAALRGGRQGAPQAAPSRGRRADPVGDADPADAQPGARRDPRPVASSRRRPRIGCRSRRASPRRRPGSSATRSCASSTVAGRSSTSTTGSRRSRPRPTSCAGCCRASASWSATARWRRASLEKVMIAFADGAADVLVCTTIIESGLDIPNANTIVIDRADTLGLAQLYQLRGRVGRSSRRAYAYLLYRRRERLSDEARKRLQAIFNASELGAGFQIALSDLEIRGAGNILGGEQSGHMAAVGFDLYSRLLAEAVESRKASMEGRAPIVEAPQAVVDLPVEAHLPDDYVPDEAQKLELYRRLARARSTGDLAAFRQEVLDRYGPMPDPVIRLIEVAELRLTAEAAGVASISREEGWLVVRFGAGLTRATAMRLLAGPSLPGLRPSDVTFASNQVRMRLPADPRKGWTLTQAAVARLSASG